jgi:hypothetical protein
MRKNSISLCAEKEERKVVSVRLYVGLFFTTCS